MEDLQVKFIDLKYSSMATLYARTITEALSVKLRTEPLVSSNGRVFRMESSRLKQQFSLKRQGLFRIVSQDMSSILFTLFFCMTLLTTLPVMGGPASADGEPPRARQGVIDLSEWDFSKDGPVDLNGQWEFYWQQLLSPEDFHHEADPPYSAFLSLPSGWNHLKPEGKSLNRKGYATFRLNIFTGVPDRELALYLGNIRSAYKLWVNNELLAESGVVGKTADEETPGQSVHLARFSATGYPLELVLQISNHHYRDGGVINAIRLGESETLHTAQSRKWGTTLFYTGSLLVMGLYHIVLFCFRRKDIAPLYFGMYCILWMSFFLVSNSGGLVINLFTGQLPVWLFNRIDLILVVLSVPVGYSFFCTLYPAERSLFLHKTAWLMALAFTVLGVTTSTFTFTSAIPVYFFFSIVMIFCSLFMLLRAVQRRREGAVFILSGFVALGYGGINDMLYNMHLIDSIHLIHAGMFIFILFQAFALSLRFSNTFYAVEQLSGELTNKNEALEAEISERNRLEGEIVHVVEETRRRISYELHDGLCQQLTGARLRCQVLKRKLSGSETARTDLSQLSTLLEESVNQAYDLSRGLWPLEPEADNVVNSLELLVRNLALSSGITIDFKREGDCDRCMHSGMAKLCRIAQEAITNAVKHASASRIVVALRCQENRQIILTVQDNGVGIKATAGTRGGLGMSIMAHRARVIGGALTVSEAEGGGTLVACTASCRLDSTEV